MSDPFAAAGSLRSSYAAVDWAASPLGPVEEWSPTLRSTVDLMLHTRHGVTLLWGPEFVLLYNEGYVEQVRDKHPAALGRPCAEVFPEVWSAIEPLLRSVLDDGATTFAEDLLLSLNLDGELRDRFFTFCYSPVRTPEGTVEGVIDITVDTTARVVTLRRLAVLGRLHASLNEARGLGEVTERVLALPGSAPHDVLAVDLVLPVWEEAGLDTTGTPDGARDPRLGDPVDPAGLEAVTVGWTPAGPVALVPLRLASGDHAGGLLRVLLNRSAGIDDDHLEFAGLLGAGVAQHLERGLDRDAERTLSTALQTSLLSRPVVGEGWQVAVHYEPAAELAQVGGDWYDAFPGPDGDTVVVIGDVTGHDHGAAASMGQLRNLLRGMAYLDPRPPSELVTALDRAVVGLGLEILATVVVGVVHAEDDGTATLTWSNAGHLPPVLVHPDGSTEVLEHTPDLMLGIDARTVRHHHRTTLPRGATLVLYTDGVVERRAEHIDAGLLRLREVLGGLAEEPVPLVPAALILALGDTADDDKAVLVLRGPR